MIQGLMCGVAHLSQHGGLDQLRLIAEMALSFARVRGSVVSFSEGPTLAVTVVGDGHILHITSEVDTGHVAFHGSPALVMALKESGELPNAVIGCTSDRYKLHALEKGA